MCSPTGTGDLFERLPLELLHQVICLLDDLPSLYALHHASPAVFAYLHAAEISRPSALIETIIARSQDNTDEQRGMLSQLRYLIRTLVYLWWRLEDDAEANPLPHSYHAVVASFNCTNLWNPVLQYPDRAKKLPKSVPPHLICRLLSFLTRLRQIAHLCFHDAISRCLSLKPERMESPRREWTTPSGWQAGPLPSKRPPGVKFAPQDVGAPSWIEEQRFLESIFRLFIFYELRRTIRSGNLSPLQPELRSLRVGDLWNKERFRRGPSDFAVEVYRTVLILLKQYYAVESLDDSDDDDDVDILEDRLFSSTIPDHQKYCCPQLRHWESDPRGYRRRMYNDMSGYGATMVMSCMPHSPARCVKHDYFRCFGLTIWDRIRLCALGFDDPKWRTAHDSRIWYAFSSILTDEQWAETYRRQHETPVRWDTDEDQV